MNAMPPTARPVFVARCTRSGESWAVGVDDAEGVHLRGANTQAKRLDQVEALVREVVSILLDVDEDSFEILLEVDLPGRLKEEISLVPGVFASRRRQCNVKPLRLRLGRPSIW